MKLKRWEDLHSIMLVTFTTTTTTTTTTRRRTSCFCTSKLRYSSDTGMLMVVRLPLVKFTIGVGRTIEMQARRQGGGVRWLRTHPPPPPPRAEKVRLEGCKDELTKKKERQRWIFSSNFSTHAALHSVENLPEVVDHLKLCSGYRDHAINSRNTITRKGRLAVVFFGSIFPAKTLKMHCQVKSLLTEPLYLLTLRLFDILFLITHTDCLLFLPHHVFTELKITADPGGQSPSKMRN